MVILSRNKYGLTIFSLCAIRSYYEVSLLLDVGFFLLPSSEKVLFEISPPILNFCKDQGSKEFKHIIMVLTLTMLVKFLSAHLCM